MTVPSGAIVTAGIEENHWAYSSPAQFPIHSA